MESGNPPTFDVKRALEHVKALSYPRQFSSPGERSAGDYIAAELESYGYEPHIHSFTYSLFPLSVIPRIVLVIQIGCVLAAVAFASRTPAAAALLLIGIIILTVLSTRWGNLFEKAYDLGRQHGSRNIFVRNAGQKSRTDVIVLAHYDSKSQSIPIVARVVCYTLFTVGVILLSAAVLILLATGKSEVVGEGFLIAGMILSAIAMPLLFNRTGNRSPGALDNASGAGIVLELARVFSAGVPVGLDVTFLFTGAEEAGLAGAIRFMQKYRSAYREEPTYCIAYDGAGASGKIRVTSSYGLPPVRTSHRLAELVLGECARLGYPSSETSLPVGAGLEQTPVSHHGIEVVTIHSGKLGRPLLAVHSPGDIPEHIDRDALERCGHIGQSVLLGLATLSDT